jgi:hypothetical protein
MEKTPDYLSHSQLTSWLQCGEKYRLTKIVGVQEDPAWYFVGGTSVHSAADAIDHQLLKEQA